MPRIFTVLLILLFSFAGCQTTPSAPLGNIFSPSTTIPPPETNSYTLNSAPPGSSTASTTPPNPDGTTVSPFAPNKPYADPYASANEETEKKLEPFQATTKEPATSDTAGSVKAFARTGDEVTIPISAFRTGSGLYSNDSRESKSSETGSATETVNIVPFPGNQ